MIHGERPAKLKSNETITANCQSCQKENAVQFTVFQNYMHLLFVPYFFATHKYAVSQCNACGEILDQENFPENYLTKAGEAKKSARTPIWFFAGLPVVLFAFYKIYLKYFS